MEDKRTEQVQRKEEVKHLFDREMNHVAKLEFIDAVQRLGLGYHFHMKIKDALHSIHSKTRDAQLSDDLYATSLRFRLLRQHGYDVPQDVFQRFMNSTGTFVESLNRDVKGLLNLYEASFHGMEGETIVDEAWNFASKHLKDLNLDEVPTNLASHVSHALDMPIHWRPNRWWDELGANKMSFCRDRLVEHYFWSCILLFEPQYTDFREANTKILCTVTLIDDVYDIYGTQEELELLTDFIVRWSITDINRLPPTIRDSFMVLYNTTNEVGYHTMKKRRINPIPYLRKVWADECKAYLKEFYWYNNGIKPTLEEYMDIAVDSVGGVILLLNSYFLTTDKVTEEGLDYVSKIPSVAHSSNKILRFNDDFSTSSNDKLGPPIFGSVLGPPTALHAHHSLNLGMTRVGLDGDVRTGKHHVIGDLGLIDLRRDEENKSDDLG
uniref:Terpene synthase n=1 Tax=Psidium guajava TaxID=120290 RepID=A0AA95ZDY2_PSIGU|nr:terpene synthase [Psidium guajava]